MLPVLNLFHLVKVGMPPLLNSIHLKKVEMVDAELLPLGEDWDGAYPWQLCRSCDSPAQGCGRRTLPWVSTKLIIATL